MQKEMTGLKLLCSGLLPWFLFASASADDSVSNSGLVQQFSKLIPSDVIRDVETFEATGFQVTSSTASELNAEFEPSGSEKELLRVESDGMFSVWLERSRTQTSGGGIMVQHPQSGWPLLLANDNDNDGRLDILTYTVMNEFGESLIEITDYDVDGQADLRLHLQEGFFEIWHQDRWYRSEVRGGVRGIVEDDQFREIKIVDNRPVIQ